MDVKAFAEKLEQVNQRVVQLIEQAGRLPKRHRQLLDQAFGELDGVLEKLQAAEHEMHEQQVQLEASKQELQAERRRYQNLFEIVPDAYIVTDLDGSILEANTAAGMLLGVTQAKLTDLPLLQFCVAQDAPIFVRALRQVQEYGRFDEQALRVRRVGAAVVEIMLKGTAICDQAGQLIAFGWLLRDMSQIKSAELALRGSQHFIESTLDSLPIHIAILDDSGTIVAVNAAWRRFGAANGYVDTGAGVGTSYLHVCDQASGDWADEAPSVARRLREIIGGQREQFQIEYPCHSPDEQRWFILTMSRFTQDQRVYVVTAHLNITERKMAEEQLRESEARFRMFADSAPVLIWLSDTEKQCTFFNQPWLEFTGRTLEQELGFGWAEGVYPEDRQRCLATYEQAHEFQQSFSMEYRLRRSDGEYRWVLDTGVPRYIADKGFAGYIGSCIDITERKQAEEALLRSEAKFRVLFDLSPETFFLLDLPSHIDMMTILDCNTAACRMSGYTHEELIGRSVDMLVGIPLPPEKLSVILERLRSGEIVNFESMRRNKNGTVFPVEVTANLIKINGQDLVLSVDRDITERKQAEDALRLYSERLRMLHEIDRAILAARSPVEVAQAALNRLRQLVPCNRVGILMLGSEGRRAVAVVVDSNGEYRVDSKLQLSLKILSSKWANGADETSQELGVASEPLIFDDPPPIIRALLADGIRSYMVLPLISQNALIGVLSLGVGETHAFGSAHLDIAREVATSVAIAIQHARLSEQIGFGSQQLRSLTRRLMTTQETERRQVAQELHDQVGQELTALIISLRLTRHHLSDEPMDQIASRLDRSMQLIEEALADIRGVVAVLRPVILDEYGLAAALRWYTQQFSERTDLDVALQLDPSMEALRLAPETETALFRVVQEALTNVVKHAHIERATVRLEADNREIRLSIVDDGIGFDVTDLPLANEHHGLGLVGMRERIQAVGGRLRLESAPGEGTRIVVEVGRL